MQCSSDDRAREKFVDFPFIQFGIFDINHDPLEQGLELGQFDLIIGANVLHDSYNIDITLSYLRELLAPGGIMMVLEGTYNPRFQLISFGFIEGLTQYQDERIETHLPLLSASRWCELIRQVGFIRYANERYEPFPLTELQYAYWIGEQGIYRQTTTPYFYFEYDFTEQPLNNFSIAFEALVRRHDAY